MRNVRTVRTVTPVFADFAAPTNQPLCLMEIDVSQNSHDSQANLANPDGDLEDAAVL